MLIMTSYDEFRTGKGLGKERVKGAKERSWKAGSEDGQALVYMYFSQVSSEQ